MAYGSLELKQVIEAKLCQVQKIHFEPRLFSPADDRLTQRQQSGSDDYLYRMKALDAVRDTGNILSWFSLCFCNCMRNNPVSYIHIFALLPLDFPFRELGGAPSAVTGKKFRTWLLQLRKSLDKDKHSSLIYTVLDGYNRARHGAEVSRFFLVMHYS
ncbi:hypothetical protein GOODEAATRI_027578 [Goodea atripinnis]|uniref:Uncharacterized protein n=1 Tax=Goodea atripinnis TaxID=208336 RepID=A0ABV0NE64_9TELE